MKMPLMWRIHKQKRINYLIEALGVHETAMRDCCAQLIELTEPGDDLHAEVLRLLAALEG
jgi:hypothetical protein